MIKWSIQEEDITLINIYACNVGAPKYIKQLLLDIKGEMEVNKITVGEFTTPLTSMNSSSGQQINKTTEIVNNTIEQFGLTWYLQDTTFKKPKIYIFQAHIENSLG